MRHVQPAFRGENQNLVAYQDGQEIYFLTVRQVDRDEELFVWYGYDYAKRLQVSTYAETNEDRPMARYVGNFPQQHTVDVSNFRNRLGTSLLFKLMFHNYTARGRCCPMMDHKLHY